MHSKKYKKKYTIQVADDVIDDVVILDDVDYYCYYCYYCSYCHYSYIHILFYYFLRSCIFLNAFFPPYLQFLVGQYLGRFLSYRSIEYDRCVLTMHALCIRPLSSVMVKSHSCRVCRMEVARLSSRGVRGVWGVCSSVSL